MEGKEKLNRSGGAFLALGMSNSSVPDEYLAQDLHSRQSPQEWKTSVGGKSDRTV